ncbi:MAG: hypothetical protein F6K04_18840, partial [Leptolyngbya sp. SIO4C5]|nr:hypothetical protein [Leptolyngbya sp. SIO4C5]
MVGVGDKEDGGVWGDGGDKGVGGVGEDGGDRGDGEGNALPAIHHSPLTPQLPTWNDELYLELHRGCYTTRAEQKWFNRRCEDELYQAELWAAIASLVAKTAYPQAELERAWKRVLFNQFHDILPGTAIAEVYAETDQDWQAALQTAQTITAEALDAIACQIDYPAPPHPDARPLLVFNPLSWLRTEVVT